MPDKTRWRLVTENNIGEMRAALYKGRDIHELFIERWSDKDRPMPGDIFAGRIRTIDKALAAAFVDLGLPAQTSPDGFLNFSQAPNAPRFREGQMLRVKVSREAEEDKGPLLSFIELSGQTQPKREQGGDLISRLKHRYNKLSVEEGALDSFDMAIEPDVALKKGGRIIIEQTQALTAIDVDTSGGGQKKAVCIAAAAEAARQIRLRSIGGLVVIDFPNLRAKKDRDDVWQCLSDNLAHDPRIGIKLAPFSRFGTVMMSVPKRRRSITRLCLDRHGMPTGETLALRALRQLEKTGRISPGAKLKLYLPECAYNWLMQDKIEWRKAAEARLGARFEIFIGSDIYVETDR